MGYAIFIAIFCMSLFSAAKPVERKLINLTASWAVLADIDFADPSAPDFSEEGVVRIYLTAGEILEWKATKSSPAWQEFLSGARPTHTRAKLYHPSGKILNESAGEDAWDLNIKKWSEDLTVAYASVMAVPTGQDNAVWPDDSWSRRVYAFEKRNGKWIREDLPLLSPLSETPTWIDHGYGHEFLTDDEGSTYVFYERVSEERDGHPWRTDLFARKMLSPWESDAKEVPILNCRNKTWPSLQRGFGGKLAEGARPFRVGKHYFISFSGGDYNSPKYGIHLLVADKILGPYRPYLNEDGEDLKDFGADLENSLPLTWGAGRAVFFELQNKWWVLFHGIPSESGEAPQDGKRNLFLAPVEFENLDSSKPTVRVGI